MCPFPPSPCPPISCLLWNFQIFTSIFNALCLALSSSHHVLLYWCFMFLFVLSYLSPTSSPLPCVFLLSLSPSASSRAQFCPYFVCYAPFLSSISVSPCFCKPLCSFPHLWQLLMPQLLMTASPSWDALIPTMLFTFLGQHSPQGSQIQQRVQQWLRWQPGKQGQFWWESGAQWVYWGTKSLPSGWESGCLVV